MRNADLLSGTATSAVQYNLSKCWTKHGDWMVRTPSCV